MTIMLLSSECERGENSSVSSDVVIRLRLRMDVGVPDPDALNNSFAEASDKVYKFHSIKLLLIKKRLMMENQPRSTNLDASILSLTGTEKVTAWN